MDRREESELRSSPDDAVDPAVASLPMIVGVGASGGAVDSIERLLASLAAKPRWATVLVLTGREALDEAELRKNAAAAGHLVVETIEDGAAPQPGTLYLLDADLVLTMREGRLRTQPSDEASGHRGTIDSFFVSLAEDQGDRAIGVILQGTGADGTLGIASLKEHGGLAIAELNPNDSSDDFAAAHLPAALADFLLPVDMIAERVVAQTAHLSKLRDTEDTRRTENDVAAHLARIATILRNTTGHDFHGYKQGTFMRRVQRRMRVRKAETVESYLEELRNDGDETQRLFNDLLIGVTQFFRDKREFHVLETQVIPKLFANKGTDDQLRVWVLGCATGEEAYSLAILLREYVTNLDRAPKIQIFATDIDVRALAGARAGRYANSISADMTPERLARWFVKEGETYCIIKELREMCIFSSHNLIKDPPFSRLDLVSCRNLLIYLDTELQSRIVPLFHFALRPTGYLFLGNSENVTRHAKLFEPIEKRSRIFRRLETEARTVVNFPIGTATAYRPPDIPQSLRPDTRDGVLERRAERIIERFVPAYVIIDEQFEVLHFSGPIGPYLGPTTGAATLDLMKLAHRDLRADLRVAIKRSAENDTAVDIVGSKMQIGGREAFLELHVAPVRDGTKTRRHFVVVFKDMAVQPGPNSGSSGGSGLVNDERIERLEAELSIKSERLQTTIEELESTNEELTSSNEEYQSLNEELQSANEELETSKEELQSVNEELNTVNGELGHRVHELTRATSDLKNFLESTQIATIFLDNALHVTTFTPAVKELFHLVETDIGRPITHIKSRIPVEQLYDDARHVLRTLATVEHAVEDRLAETRYVVRIMPYRSTDNFIAGVVITFTNVTMLIRAETALRESEARYRAIFESAAEYAIITIDLDRRITGWSPGAQKLMGWEPAEVLGHSADLIFTPEDRGNDIPQVEMQKASEEGRAADERWHQRKDGSRFWGSGAMTPLQDGQRIGYLKIFSDRTEARAAEDRQRTLLGELQHRVRNTLGVVRSIARRTGETSLTVDDYISHLDGRLKSFARVQAVVTRDPTAGIDLANLVTEELHGYHSAGGEQISIEGPAIRLRSKAAETFGLALHELTTNAIKHGALSLQDGRLSVTWDMVGAGETRILEFMWVETGVRILDPSNLRRGFGTDLLEKTLFYELQAQSSLIFEPDGLRCRITMAAKNDIIFPESETAS